MFDSFQIPEHLIPSDPRFACGPSLVPVEFVKRLYETGPHLLGTSHRKPAVKDLVGEVISGLNKFFNLPDDYTVVLGNGGATFLFDMIGLGMVEKKSVHYTCGEFSQKWFKSHNGIPWIEAQEIASEYGKGVDVKPVDGADMICLTLNETSTGVQTTVVPPKSADYLIAVDATSGGGQVPMDVSTVDMFFFSPQKVFASEGGFYVAIMSPQAIERARKIAQNKDRYVPGIMNWNYAIDNSVKNQTYNTPAISTIFFLNEQIKLMNELGYEKVIEGAQKKADHIYNWAESKDYLSPYIEVEQHRSIAVATIDVDPKVDTAALIKFLRDKKVVYDIDAYRKLGRNQFRIALFHNIKHEDICKLTELLSLMIETY